LLEVALAGVMPDSIERRFFDVPGAAPLFVGDLLLGLAVGWLANRRSRSSAAAWVFLPASALFIYNFAAEVLFSSQPPGWQHFLRNYLSNDCLQTSCIGVEAFTIPLFSTVAYAVGARIAVRKNPANVKPPRASEPFRSLAGYIENLLLACGAAWLMAMVYVVVITRSQSAGLPARLFGPPLFLMSVLVPAGLGCYVRLRTGSRLPLWVWPIPLLGQSLVAAGLAVARAWGANLSWSQAYACAGCSGVSLGIALYSLVPAYGAVAYSVGAALCPRKRKLSSAERSRSEPV
jgi:hypothetical protein